MTALSPSTLIYTPRGIFSFTASPNSQTTVDYRITAPLFNFGERIYAQNAAMGDSFDLYLIDKDNVIGQGGTPGSPTILAHFARNLYIAPNTFMESNSPATPAAFNVGLYLRGVYTSTSLLTPVNFMMNLRTYEQYSDFLTDSG